MSEEALGNETVGDSTTVVGNGAGDSGAAALPPTAFGARLLWERERAGLSQPDVAARLRLHPNQVRALEQETLAVLPEAAYVRGFVRSYARILDIDPAPLLQDLAAKLGATDGSVVDRMASPRDFSPVRAAAREQASRQVVMVGAIVLLVVLGALGWYVSKRPQPTAAPAPAPVVSTPAPVAPPPATPAAEPAPAASVPAAEGAAAMEPVPVPPLLKLRFTGTSWAEVKDAEGKVLHSQHNTAGTEFVVEGTPPFYVVIGDAGVATVEVRGDAFDLAPHTRQNVARFTIN